MSADVQARRKVAFLALLQDKGYSENDYDEDVEEDIRPYVSGTEKLGRFVCVTKNLTHSGGKLYFLPKFDNLDSARDRAEEFADDDLFEELPVEVVDLDSNVTYYAEHKGFAWYK